MISAITAVLLTLAANCTLTMLISTVNSRIAIATPSSTPSGGLMPMASNNSGVAPNRMIAPPVILMYSRPKKPVYQP
ncbi:MAG: hypothetical protein JWR34_2237 [Mycobacterium sp.]|nr:hypothetical protein [Mycobacterium sp.]